MSKLPGRPSGAELPGRPSGAELPGRPSGAELPGRPSGATPHLLCGHATDTLSPAERSRLYRAALADQDIFDQLVEEESWRRIFSAPGVRQELLEALAEPAPAIAPGRERGITDALRGWLAGLWGVLEGGERHFAAKRGRRYMPSLAMGAAAAGLLALVLIPRWLELGVAGPLGPGEEPPKIATAPAGETAPGFVAKSYGGSPRHSSDEAPPRFVAKSYGGSPESTAEPRPASATRSLWPKSTGSDYLNLSYTLELNQPGGARQVPDTYAFSPGDQFRLRLGVDFTAWLYLFNRAVGDDTYSVLYPHTAGERGPLPPSQRDVLLPAGIWLTMDDSPEDEELVLVVSAQPWPPAEAGRAAIPAGELDAALAGAEADFGSLSWRRSEVEDRVRFTVEEGESAVVVVLRLLPDS